MKNFIKNIMSKTPIIKKELNSYEVEIYIFGECRTVYFDAEESLEELEMDENLICMYALRIWFEEMTVQKGIKKI